MYIWVSSLKEIEIFVQICFLKDEKDLISVTSRLFKFITLQWTLTLYVESYGQW